MADVIAWIDGFDHLSASQSTRKGYSVAYGGTSTGRYGGQSAQFTSPGQAPEKVLTTSAAWRVGFGLKIVSHNGGDLQIFRLRDGGTEHVDIGISSTRQIRITRNGTQLNVSTPTLTTGQWYYVEWYVVISDSISLGQCQVYLEGTQVINSIATTDTRNGGNASADRFAIVGYGSNNYEIDDLVVSTMDTTTTPTFLGDMKVQTLYPSGDGNYSQFVGSDSNSVNNSLLVDETGTINDSDYVTSSTVSNKDSYAMDNFSTTPTSIKAVRIVGSVKKDDAGTRTGRFFNRISSTDYESSDFTPAASFTCEGYIWELSPASGIAWTASEINGMECGVKVQS